jgi:hypothetical protein
MRFTHGCLFRCDNSICCAQKTDDTCRQSEELIHFQVSYEIHLPRHWYCSDSFVVSISHELRTPLHGILAAAELLSDTQLNHTQSSFLQTVQACGTSLVETVNHVLDFTKLSGNSKAGGVEHVIRTTKCALHHCLLLSFLTIFTKISSSNPQDRCPAIDRRSCGGILDRASRTHAHTAARIGDW